MIYLNNFFPVRVYHSSELDKYRLEAPLADKDTIQWNEDFLSRRLPASYKLENTIWVLNPRIFPPVPLGTSMFTVFQNDIFPYDTHHITWVAFPIMTNMMTIIGNFSFIIYTTSIPRTIPIFITNEDISCRLTIDQEMIQHYFQITPFQDKALNRDNFLIYVFLTPYLFWRGTTEFMCIPSDDADEYATLVDCQKNTYKKIRNKKSFTGNSASPLALIRDQVYPSEKANITIPSFCLGVSFIIFIAICIWIYFQKKKKPSDGHQDQPRKPVLPTPYNPRLHIPLLHLPSKELVRR